MAEIIAPPRTISFYRQHHRMLSFLGALIVFMTFVVKEQLQERWKHTAESIETASYIYSIRVDTGMENRHFLTIMGQIISTKSEPKGMEPGADDNELQFAYENEIGEMRAKLNALSVLLEKTPGRASFEHQQKDLLAKSKPLQAGVAAVATGSAARMKAVNGNSAEYWKQRDRDWSGAIKPVEQYIAEVAKFEASVQEEIEDVLRRDRKRSAIAGWISIVLYTVGWGLGLAGKLVGDDEVVTIE